MLSIYHTHLQAYLSPDKIVFIEMLLRVIQVFKEIKIEKLAGRLPIPIKWQENNILMVAIIIDRRAMPIYWEFLDKKGCSNLAEQQRVLRQVFELFSEYQIF